VLSIKITQSDFASSESIYCTDFKLSHAPSLADRNIACRATILNMVNSAMLTAHTPASETATPIQPSIKPPKRDIAKGPNVMHAGIKGY
jgi:hypothetical protein